MFNVDYQEDWNKYHMPNGYRVDEKGMLLCDESKISGTPFVFVGKTNEVNNGAIFYMIRYQFGNEQKEFIAKATELQLKGNCAKLLVGHSFKVSDMTRNFNKVMQYIMDSINDYGDSLKVITATETNGWNEDFSVFYVGENGITKEGVIPIYTTLTNPKFVDVFEKKGTEKKWIEIAKFMLDFDLVRFLFYDSMTAPLIKLIGLESHSFEHTGKTRSGKTTITKFIASAIGEPKEMLFTAKSTSISIVEYINQMSDIPTFLEEATTKKAKENVKSVIYDIANGMQKMRAQIDGKLREDIKTFDAVTHVTCESSLRDEMDHAGEMYRLNSLDEMLPHIKGLGDIKNNIENNYGFFFEKYIQEILFTEDLREIYKECCKSIEYEDDENNLVESSKNLFAGIMVAGILCERVFEDMGIENKDPKEIVQKYFNRCVLKNNVELDHIRALRMINDWVAQNDMAFMHGVDDGVDSRIREPYGIIMDMEIRIVWKQFDKILKEGGFNSPKNIAKCLYEDGIIRANKENGKITFRMGKQVPEGVIIKIPEMEIRLELLDFDV